MNKTDSYAKYQCHLCFTEFTTLQRLESHLQKKIPCTTTRPQLKSINQFICQYCSKKFARKDNLAAHIKKNRCPGLQKNIIMESSTKLKKKITLKSSELNPSNKQLENVSHNNLILLENLKKEIVELKEKTTIIDELKEKTTVIDELKKEITELRVKPMINNQVLQFVCITNNDNYLDWGPPP